MDAVLAVDGLSKKFCRSLRRSLAYAGSDMLRDLLAVPHPDATLRKDEFWAVRDLSFSLHAGECLSLIGPNGSGKSSVLKMLNGVLVPDGGRIRARGRIGALIELGAGFHPMLTGRENIRLSSSVLGMSRREIDSRLDEIAEFSELGAFLDMPVRHYSSGMYVRLGFAVSSRLRPEILLIDEVLAVGDVSFRAKCLAHIRTLMEEGVGVILVSHNFIDVLRLADRGIVLFPGRQVFEGPAEEAINAYQKELRSAEAGGRPAEAGPETRIESVVVQDTGGRERREFDTGEDLCVEITVRSRRAIEAARLIVAVEAPVQGIVTSVSSAHQLSGIRLGPGLTSAVLRLRSLPLLQGHYGIRVNLYGAGPGDFLDRRDNAGEFRVVSPPVDRDGFGVSGLIAVNHDWRIGGTRPS